MAKFIKVEVVDPITYPYFDADGPRIFERWINADLVQYIYTEPSGFTCVMMLGCEDPIVVDDSLDILRAKLTEKGE